MKRIPLIPVLLVVLSLLCAPTVLQTAAWADDGGGAMHAPGTGKHTEDTILDPTGTPGDDSDGDPDTAGDGFGFMEGQNLLGDSSAGDGAHHGSWVEFLFFLLDHCPILVIGH